MMKLLTRNHDPQKHHAQEERDERQRDHGAAMLLPVILLAAQPNLVAGLAMYVRSGAAA